MYNIIWSSLCLMNCKAVYEKRKLFQTRFIYRLIHEHFHIGLVIIPRPPLHIGPKRSQGPIWVEV